MLAPDFERKKNTEKCNELSPSIINRMIGIASRNIFPLHSFLKHNRVITDSEDIELFTTEVGSSICRVQATLVLTDPKPCINLRCDIDVNACQKMNGEYIGSFHTHPIYLPRPSATDLGSAIIRGDRWSCIGGSIGGKISVACYTPKSNLTQKDAQKIGILGTDTYYNIQTHPKYDTELRWYNSDEGDYTKTPVYTNPLKELESWKIMQSRLERDYTMCVYQK